MSMADMMMRFANHAEIDIESVRKAIEDDNEQVPPYSLIAWPIR
jgi:hypothetical protein